MKKQLKSALEHAEKYLKLYMGIPTGGFGAITIQNHISEGKDILNNFDKTDKALIKRIIKKLNEIE